LTIKVILRNAWCKNMDRKIIYWKTMGIRPVGRPRQRWQEDVMEDLKKAES